MAGKWFLIPVAVVLAGLVAGGVGLLRREKAGTPARAVAAQEEHRPAPVEVSLPARIEAQQVFTVEAEIGGNLEELLVDVGEEVYQGQLLARIGNRSVEGARENARAAAEAAQARVAKLESALLAARLEASRARADADRARSEMERAERNFSRQKMLYGEGATPRLTYERAERESDSAQKEFASLDVLARHAEERVQAILADLENSRKLLADRTGDLEWAQEHVKAGEVLSPYDGLVVGRRGEAGKPIGEDGNLELCRIAVNTARLRAVVEADPGALARLAVGDEAMLFFADIPGEAITGSIAAIQEDRVLIDFISPSPLVKPGMTAQVRLSLR